jgi:hypothetical protein
VEMKEIVNAINCKGEGDHPKGDSCNGKAKLLHNLVAFVVLLYLFLSDTKIQQKNETTKFFFTFFNFFDRKPLPQNGDGFFLLYYIYTSPCPPCSDGSKKKGLGSIRAVEHLN